MEDSLDVPFHTYTQIFPYNIFNYSQFLKELFIAKDTLVVIEIIDMDPEPDFFMEFYIKFPNVIFRRIDLRLSSLIFDEPCLPLYKFYKNEVLYDKTTCTDPRVIQTKIQTLLINPEPTSMAKALESNSNVDFSNLPYDAWEAILKRMTSSSICTLRCVSTKMRNLIDDYLEHKYLTIRHRESKLSPKMNLFFKCIHTTIDPYFRSRYTILMSPSLLDQLYETMEPFQFALNEKIVLFITLFSKRLLFTQSQYNIKNINICYTLALIGLVKLFPKTQIIAKKCTEHCWRLVFEIQNAFIGRDCDNENGTNIKFVFGVLMTNLCFASLTTAAYNFTLFDERANGKFVYGIQEHTSTEKVKTLIEFKLQGSENICSLLENYYKDPESVIWPINVVNEDFDVSIKVFSNAAEKWGNAHGFRFNISSNDTA